jgi:hypothetical protein
MIEDDLSWVEESATKSIYKLGVGVERCEKKDEKSAPKFVHSSSYHKEEKAIKSIKVHYPSNLKPSFNPKREVKRQTLSREIKLLFACFFSRAGHLDKFCFHHKRIERMRFEYAINSYRDEFPNFPPRSYSRASPHTSSRALPQFYDGPNHHLYSFGS